LVWRIDGASRDIDAPAGVVFWRQISADSVEPSVASRSRNLLSHDDSGPTGTDEAMKVRPQMPWIICSETFARRGERLARARSRPDGTIVWPSSKSRCNGPEAASGKEMGLGVVSKVIRFDILDRSIVNIAGRDHVAGNQFAQYRAGGRVYLVVVGRHAATPSN
jgi:hypothetical protein